MTATDIEWADEVWNPLVGCSRISPGCTNCYAIGVAHRSSGPVPLQAAHAGLTVKRPGEPADWTGEIRCLPERLTLPAWRDPKRVFVNSMSDLFHQDAPVDFIAEVFATMALNPRHTFLVLTKRPQRMAHLLDDAAFVELVQQAVDARFDDPDFTSPGDDPGPWPLANVQLGASIENNGYAWRANHVRATNAAVRILSLEPLLGPLPALNLDGIDWVVAGGESGHRARAMHPDWVRDIRDRCADAGAAFFFKQWGEWIPYEEDPQPPFFASQHGDTIDGHLLPADLTDHHPTHGWWLPPIDVDEASVVYRRVGKHAAGRFLDGRTWNEIVEVPSHV